MAWESVCRISAPISVPTRLKRPPSSKVPPRATARMASSSIIRPALLPSALFTLDAMITPATAAVTPQNRTRRSCAR